MTTTLEPRPGRTDRSRRTNRFGPSLGTLVLIALFGAGAAAAQVSVVTAVRDGGGNLKLISWDEHGIRMNEQGAQAGAVSLISAVRMDLPDSLKVMATAVRDGDGNLKIIVWKVPFNGKITRIQNQSGLQNQAGAVSRISAAANAANDRLVTAVRDGGGNLKLIPWSVSAQGFVNRLQGDGTGGAVGASLGPLPLDHVISATFLGISENLATAVRDGGGNLKVISWEVSAGGQITRLDDAGAGAVSKISAGVCSDNTLGVPIGTVQFQTSVRDGAGKLKILTWRTPEDGKSITPFPPGGSTAGVVSLISTACFVP